MPDAIKQSDAHVRDRRPWPVSDAENGRWKGRKESDAVRIYIGSNEAGITTVRKWYRYWARYQASMNSTGCANRAGTIAFAGCLFGRHGLAGRFRTIAVHRHTRHHYCHARAITANVGRHGSSRGGPIEEHPQRHNQCSDLPSEKASSHDNTISAWTRPIKQWPDL